MATDELKYINAIIGLFIPSGGSWPCPFQGRNYELVGVQREVTTLLEGRVKTIVPEAIVASHSENHVLLVDVKSRRISRDQARSYASVTGDQVVTQGLLSSEFQPNATYLDGAFVGDGNGTELIARRLHSWSLSIPTVAESNSHFRKIGGAFRNPLLETAFSAGIEIGDEVSWPNHFVPVNGGSDDGELAPIVMTSVSRFILAGESFSAAQVAESTIDYWAWCGDQERSTLINKIHNLLKKAQVEELSGYYRQVPIRSKSGHPRSVRWQTIGEGRMSPQRRSSLMRDVTSFVLRQQDGTPYIRDQPRLFY